MVPIFGSYRDCCEWSWRVLQHRGHPDPFLAITDQCFAVAEAAMTLVLQHGREPSHAEIAAAVRAQHHKCSVRSVGRHLTRLRTLGYLAWQAAYELGRRWAGGVRVPQVRRVANVFTFYLPAVAIPAAPRTMKEALQRAHSCDRPAKNPVEQRDGQLGRVSPNLKTLPLETGGAGGSLTPMERQAVNAARWMEGKEARHAAIRRSYMANQDK